MSDSIGNLSAFGAAVTVIVAAVTCVALIAALYPWLQRYALAKPNARSSHRIPTPLGGGIAVMLATTGAVGVARGFFLPGAAADFQLAAIAVAALAMAGLGAIDDLRPLPVIPRLLLQTVLVAGLVYTLPADVRAFPALPWGAERALLLIGGLWFVNLVNFMDGLDWMTVAELVPLTAALALIGFMRPLPPYGPTLALALGGAMIGFAFFNRPPARLFLGDVGSLPIGLLLGWLLLLVAASGHLVAALVMPLYYLADATITLMRRLVRGEPVWQAHRTHFYQLATDRGFTVTGVVVRVFLVNIVLSALAVMTVIAPGRLGEIVALVGGMLLVAWLLVAFARGRT